MKTEYRHFYIPYTLKEQPTSITCRTGTCEVIECCEEDTPTCIPSDEAVLTETTETKGCMCDNEAKDETKKMCAKGSYCWTDNTCNAGKRVAQVFVLEFETTLAGVEPEEFNTNVKMIEAFKATIAQMLVGVDLKDIYDVVAIAPKTRMRLLAANEAAISYKVKAKSKAQATQAKTDMVKGNDEFTDILKEEMVKNDVVGISTSNMKATTSDNIVVKEESEAEVEKEMKESKDGSENKAVNNPTNNNDASSGPKEDTSKDLPVGEMIAGMCVGCLLFGVYMVYRGKQREAKLEKHVIELVEQRHHDAMNNNPMNTHEHKKKRRSSSAFPGQEATIGYHGSAYNGIHHGNEELVLEQTTPEPTFDVFVDDASGRRYSVNRATQQSQW